ncbi:hypothetical protein [Photobacterium sp. TY1-4]|uniref:hypothetical protein n=1 Tax=Photobacterium sp. TY1-4 TaxID=2899122 RepID=UPI0021BFC465|nr:hypothetical protein [Photobacterium sp. TY1-4]UXI04034.1 hypothetical protein NH461_18145 [Photobacterium sp. TY1-4]
MKLLSSLLLMFFVAACTSQEAVTDVAGQKRSFIEKQCYAASVDNLSSTFQTFMSERQQELKTLRPELTADNYEQLNFALEHFSTYWSQLRSERNHACELHAQCEYIWLKNKEMKQFDQDYCAGTGFEYSVSRAKMINFFSDIERLQLQREAQ